MDDLVVRSAQKGNMDDFRRIVEYYQSVVFAICFNVLKDHHEAENAAQETFIKVYNSLGSYEFKGFKTWISRIALNKSIDIRRKLQSDKSYNTIPLDENIEYWGSDKNSIEEKLIKIEETQKIKALCDKLPEAYGVVINKYYIEAKSYEQIAKEEGISIKTVESRLYRGKRKLKESWGEGG